MNHILNRVKIRNIVLNFTSFEKLQTTTKTGISRKIWASFESTNHIYFKWFFPGFGLKKFFCHCRYRWAVPPETFFKKIRPRLCFRSQVGDISILIFVHRKVRVLKQYPPKKFSWKCRHGSEYANGLWRAKLKGAQLSFTRPHDTNVILVHGKAAAIGTTSKGRAFLGVKSFSFLQKDEFFEIFCFQSSR